MVSDSVPIPISEEDNGDSMPLSSRNGKEEVDDLQNSASEMPLLPSRTVSLPQNSPQKPSKHTLIFISLILTTCTSIILAVVFACLFFSSSSSSPVIEFSRPLTKLKKPTVLLISFDGFRFGYHFKTQTPNIDRLIKNGTEAALGMIPVFPTLTFPNHYSIVTGLYPSHHGIVNNFFIDPVTGDFFTMASHEPKWWLGEPLWETVVNHGLKAAVYFWPGSEVKKGSWACPKDYCKHYNSSIPFEERVDAVLSYFDLPSDQVPSFITLYFENPDHPGHKFGPDDPRVTEAIDGLDKILGRLIRGLEDREIFEDLNIILVGDHGMVGTCDKKLIFLDELADFINVPKEWVQSYSPLLALSPPNFLSTRRIVEKMNEGLKSGNVSNGQYLRVYLKEDLPERLHYRDSDRIAPIIGMIEEGFKVEMQAGPRRQECGGSHGYDNSYFSMRSIFVGHGPRFSKGKKVPSFENVEIYNVIASILNIQGAENNGTRGFAQGILLPL